MSGFYLGSSRDGYIILMRMWAGVGILFRLQCKLLFGQCFVVYKQFMYLDVAFLSFNYLACVMIYRCASYGEVNRQL